MAVTRKYAQINACTNEVVLIGDESLGMPVADSNLVYTINISSHSQKDEIDVYWTYSKTTELFTEPSKDPLPIPVVHEIIADSAEKSGTDTIVLTVSQDFMTGTVVKFVAPCDCVGISKINILDKTFSLVDAVGNSVSTISGATGGVFSKGSVIAIALNIDNGKAYIQNAAKTNNVYMKSETYSKSEIDNKFADQVLYEGNIYTDEITTTTDVINAIKESRVIALVRDADVNDNTVCILHRQQSSIFHAFYKITTNYDGYVAAVEYVFMNLYKNSFKCSHRGVLLKNSSPYISEAAINEIAFNKIIKIM